MAIFYFTLWISKFSAYYLCKTNCIKCKTLIFKDLLELHKKFVAHLQVTELNKGAHKGRGAAPLQPPQTPKTEI
jgi:hypothetical protein